MKKQFVSALAVLTSLSTTVPAVYADSSTSQPSASKNSSTAKTSKSSDSNPVTMTAGIISGFVVGWPVCLVRRFKRDEAQGARGIVGDTENKFLLGSAGAIWLPFAFATSFMEAPVYALRNSYVADKPFSKDQFSLGDMPDYD